MLKNIRATNKNGESINFDHRFRITKGLDLSGLSADVNSSQSTGPGSRYQNTRLKDRDFEVEFKLIRGKSEEYNMDERRKKIYRVFNPELNPIRIDFETSNRDKYYLITHLEGSPSMPPDTSNNNAAWQRGLLQFHATDPFIYSSQSTVVDLASWIGNFEFPLEIPEEGIEMGYRSQSLIANVLNEGQTKTGMIILYKALASVSNPSLINVNTYESFKLNVSMIGGDIIEVSTYVGKKTVTLIRNNVSTNIFNSVELSSTFLQLAPGDNLFRYDAETGIDNLEVSMSFINRFVGV